MKIYKMEIYKAVNKTTEPKSCAVFGCPELKTDIELSMNGNIGELHLNIGRSILVPVCTTHGLQALAYSRSWDNFAMTNP